MVLLGLSGAKGSGKGTVAQFVAEWATEHGLLAVERGFADKLKWAMARIFYPGISLKDALMWANELKNEDHMRVVIEDVRNPSKHIVEITGRQLFQHGGTEMGRDIFGSNFWVDQLLPLGIGWSEGERRCDWEENFVEDGRRADIAIISDLRFPNEVGRVNALGGAIWDVRRPGHDPDGHASEVPIDPRFIRAIIENDGSLDDLRQYVDQGCERFIKEGVG